MSRKPPRSSRSICGELISERRHLLVYTCVVKEPIDNQSGSKDVPVGDRSKADELIGKLTSSPLIKYEFLSLLWGFPAPFSDGRTLKKTKSLGNRTLHLIHAFVHRGATRWSHGQSRAAFRGRGENLEFRRALTLELSGLLVSYQNTKSYNSE